MKKIRSWGIRVFLLLVIVITVFWFLVVDKLIQWKIETEGTEAVGARVELDEVDLTLIPTGLTLSRLQVTNPEEPMTNAVEIKALSMDLDGLNLLRQKVIIDEMVVAGVRFGTPRTTSGAISTRRDEGVTSGEQEGEAFQLPPFEVPDVQKILEQEDLETLRLIKEIEEDIQREKKIWEERLQELPGTVQFGKYKKRLEDLKSSTKKGVGGILGGVEEVQAIQKEIERDLKQLETAQKEFDDKVALLKRRLAQAKSAPQNDMRRLKEKYSLSPQGLANLGQTLLGKQIGDKLHEATVWYEKLQPYLAPAREGGGAKQEEEEAVSPSVIGKDTQRTGPDALPDFLIRLAKVNLSLDVGEITGKIENITSDQAILGKPLTVAFSGKQLRGLRSMWLQGELDHRVPGQSSNVLQFHAEDYRLQDITLSEQTDWPVALREGLAEVSIDTVVKGEAITVTGISDLSSLRLSAGRPEDSNPLTKALSSAIADISSLSIKADVTGTLQHYEVRISSELDRVLQEAAGNMVQALSREFGKELQSAIHLKVKEPLAQLKGNIGGVDAIGRDLTSRVGKGNKILEDLLEQDAPTKILPGGLTLPF